MRLRVSIFASFMLCAGLVLSTFALPIRTNASVHCIPTSWRDVLTFLIVNYLSHAATVPAQPGADWRENLPWIIISLLLPFAVWGRSFGLILGHFLYGESDIGKAITRGAVVTVARSENWEPPINQAEPLQVYVKLPKDFLTATPSEQARFDVIPSSSSTTIDERYYITHGQIRLPRGYQLVLAPRFNFPLEQFRDPQEIKICRSQSWLKMAVSVGQLILSCITIYRARGSQLDKYGYAAFGLSVFPYALMSFVNLVCIGIVGDYPTLYLLRTAVLDEAKRCGGTTCGEVGIMKEDDDEVKGGMSQGDVKLPGAEVFTAASVSVEVRENAKILTVKVDHATRKFKLVDKNQDATYIFGIDSITNQATNPWAYSEFGLTRRVLISMWLILPPLIALIPPYLFIFLLTGFHQRGSTFAERTWMISWLVASQLAYLFLLALNAVAPHFSWLSLFLQYKTDRLFQFFAIFVFPLLLLFIPAVGGFVMVGRMLFTFGTCSL